MDQTSSAFTALFGVAEGLGALILILTGIWLTQFRGGFAWTSNPGLEFNWHPLLMTIGLIFLYGNSILVYRAFRSSPKPKVKVTHAAIHGIAFVVAVIGLQTAFDSHNLKTPPIQNMYSLHSWVGLAAVILFSVQWIAGFVAFLFPTVKPALRTSLMPFHVFFGLTGFILAVAAALMGFTEKAIWTKAYEKLEETEWILVNVIGTSIVLFAVVVIYLATETRYKRQPLPEEQIMLDAASPK